MEMTLASATTQRAALELAKNQQDQSAALLRMSTAQKINSAAEDAVNLALSTGFRAQIATLDQSAANTYDAISYSETAGSTLDGAADLLMRAEELSVRAANDTLGEDERALINSELETIKGSLNDLAAQAGPGGRAPFGNAFSVYTGQDLETLSLDGIDAESLGIDGIGAGSASEAAASLGALDNALNSVLQEHGKVSTFAGSMAIRSEQLGRQSIDTRAALSRVADADFAKEASNLAISSIKADASMTAMVHTQRTMQSFFQSLFG
ncbi:MAG: flagellin [Rhodothermales bacterium]